jgi:hypothetical protein
METYKYLVDDKDTPHKYLGSVIGSPGFGSGISIKTARAHQNSSLT